MENILYESIKEKTYNEEDILRKEKTKNVTELLKDKNIIIYKKDKYKRKLWLWLLINWKLNKKKKIISNMKEYNLLVLINVDVNE